MLKLALKERAARVKRVYSAADVLQGTALVLGTVTCHKHWLQT